MKSNILETKSQLYANQIDRAIEKIESQNISLINRVSDTPEKSIILLDYLCNNLKFLIKNCKLENKEFYSLWLNRFDGLKIIIARIKTKDRMYYNELDSRIASCSKWEDLQAVVNDVVKVSKIESALVDDESHLKEVKSIGPYLKVTSNEIRYNYGMYLTSQNKYETFQNMEKGWMDGILTKSSFNQLVENDSNSLWSVVPKEKKEEYSDLFRNGADLIVLYRNKESNIEELYGKDIQIRTEKINKNTYGIGMYNDNGSELKVYFDYDWNI